MFANRDSFEVHPTPILPIPSRERFPFEASVYPSAFWDTGLGFWCGAIYERIEWIDSAPNPLLTFVRTACDSVH